MFAIILVAASIVIALGINLNRRPSLRKTLRFESETSPRLRISIVVDKNRSVDYVTQLLATGSLSYEVVVVADFNNDQHSLRHLIRRFNLIKRCFAYNSFLVRGIYRSSNRLYSSLTVINYVQNSNLTPFEIGSQLSRYNYILHIAPNRILRFGAIDSLLLELSLHPEGSVDSIESRLFENFKLRNRDSATPHQGKQIKICYRILKQTSA